MRPAILNDLFSPVTALPGIGPKVEKLFRRLVDRADGARLVDIVLHLPSGAIDRRTRPKLRDVIAGQVVTIAVTVDHHRPPPKGRARAPYIIHASDETGDIVITYFSARPEQLEKLYPPGARRYVSGTAKHYDGVLQMVHPDKVVDELGLADLPLVEPTYPLTEGLYANQVRKAVQSALARLRPLPEWQDPAWIARRGFPSFAQALERLHRPRDLADVAPDSPAWQRLAYDELLAWQLALVLVRARLRRQRGRSTVGSGELRKDILARLAFELTPSQRHAYIEIVDDLARPMRMLRLLQGDVGSGKTIVALLASAVTIEAGRQAVIMAPTEILARQHLATVAPLAAATGMRVALLSGRERGRERALVLQALAAGEVDLLVGTHALFQDEVHYHDLALAVVDEQHRFGVHQRLALATKGEAVDILVMTATPIPRTLVLSCFGDMDVSELREKPAGRQPVDTRALPAERLDEVVAAIGRALDERRQVYWVCPLIEESALSDLAAAQERHAALRERFGDRVGLVHGRMRGADKDRAMRGFASGETPILVATTVIEVGVDVAQASVMVIEHAERFGLAQLHQLRGRIGRGSDRAICLLLYRAPLGEAAKARLAILRETQDGFRIAEEDLRLRGEGDVLGVRQSGMPGLRIARLHMHAQLLTAARDDAALILARDPQLSSPRGEALRTLLYLFEKDAATKLFQAG
ncbi:MAG: ATP-dependent DNA helicase RecG [Proteobacteria bacterium]|nr:ATP-dependent DNA helicase RecG [Pseudomonadota bacterium]